MMRAMRRDALASILIICWVALSGLDLLEDLNHLGEHQTVAGSSSSDHVGPKRGGWGTLANNIVESAHRTGGDIIALLVLADSDGGCESFAFDFRGYFPRHKLYRVFLI